MLTTNRLKLEMDKIEKIIKWYLDSPIYIDGAYRAFYSSSKTGPIYPEITGYSISLSSILYTRRNDEQFLKRAKTSAEYMTKITKDGGAPSFSDNLLYTFDTAIYVSGVLDLYAVTKQDQYLQDAEKSLQWIMRLWKDKPFSAVNEIPAESAWYHQSAVHLVKLAIPFIKASVYLRSSEYENTALELLDKYAKFQTEDGSFIVTEGSDIVMAHPHCYATESYLYAYGALKKSELLKIAEKAINWLTKVQNSDGSFYRCYDINNNVLDPLKTSDAIAQATRLWKLLGVNEKNVELAYRYLDSVMKDDGLRLFKRNSFRSKLAFNKSPVYSWPTFFYLHSLLLPFGEMKYWPEIF